MIETPPSSTGIPRATSALAASSDGRRLALLARDEALVLAAPSLAPLARLRPCVGRLVGAAWSADGRALALGGSEGLALLAPDSGERLLFVPELVGPPLLSPDGRIAAAEGRDGLLVCTALRPGPRRLVILGDRHDRQATREPLAFSPDGRTLALGWSRLDEDGVALGVELVDALDGRCLAMLPGERAPAWDAEGGLLTLTADAGALRRRRPGALALVEEQPLDQPPPPEAHLAWAPGAAWLASWTWGGRGRLDVRARDGRVLSTSELGGPVAEALSCGSEGLLVLRAEGPALELRDPWSGERLRALGPSVELGHAALAPDGTWMLTVAQGRARALEVLALPDGARLARWEAAGTPLGLSPDGRTLALSRDDGGVVVWDAARRRLLGELPGHAGGVVALEWSACGGVLATSGEDMRVRTWSLAPLGPLHELAPDDDGAPPLIAAAPGRALLAAQGQGDRPEPPALLDLRAGTLRHLPPDAGELLGWLDDGRLVCLDPLDPQALVMWDAQEAEGERLPGLAPGGVAALIAAGGHLAALTRAGVLLAWTEGAPRPFTLHAPDELVAWELLPEGRLAVLGASGTLLVWGLPGGERLLERRGVHAFAAHPPGGGWWLACGPSLERVDDRGQTVERRADAPGHHPLGLSVSADGALVLSRDAAGVVLRRAAGPARSWRVDEGGLTERPVAAGEDRGDAPSRTTKGAPHA